MRIQILFTFFIIACNNSAKVDSKLDTSEQHAGVSTDQAPAIITTDYVDLVKVDRTTKCNLATGIYILKPGAEGDSLALTRITRQLASDLFSESKKDPACAYPVMAIATVYLSGREYQDYEGNYIARCVVSPQDYAGRVTIVQHKLKELQK